MFLIQDTKTKGYLYDDEDKVFSYSPDIDEYTVKFNTREEAERECFKWEIVVEI